MRANLDDKSALLVLRMILFSCALFVLLAGIGAAFLVPTATDAARLGLEKLAIMAAVCSPLAILVIVIGKNYLNGLLERQTGESKIQTLIGGATLLAGVCEAPGLLWAFCAYLLNEPLYAIGSVAHAIGILFLWPDGSELGNGNDVTIAEGDG